jgi:ATP-binding cassette subfamily B protein
MNVVELFKPILKPYKWHFAMMFQIPMVGVAFHVLNAYALKLIIDSGTKNGWELAYPILIFVGISTFQEIVCRAGQWAFNQSQPYIRGEIVSKAYEYVQNHSHTYFQNTPSGSITSKIKGIVSGYDSIFEYVWFKITNPLVMCIFGTASLLFINVYLAALVFAWCIVFFVVGLKMSLKLKQLSTVSNDLKHKVIGLIADNITNIFTIFAFAKKQNEARKIRNFACGEVADMDYKKNFYQFKFTCTGAVLFVLMSGSVLCFTAYLRHIDQITLGDFGYVISILYKIIYDIWELSERVGSFFDKLGDFKSSFSILATPQEALDKPDAKDFITGCRS